MTKVIACIDASNAAASVCDYAAWAAERLAAPLTLLHVLDQACYPVASDLSGKLGLNARKHLLSDLAELDTRRNKLALEQGELILQAARQRAVSAGVADPVLRQRHGYLLQSLAELEEDSQLLVIGKPSASDSDARHAGDHVEQLVRALHRPILIAEGEFKAPQVVMLAFDSSETTRKGVELFAASPLFRGVKGHLVTVSKDRQTLSKDLAWAEKTIRDAGHDIQCAVLDGEIEPALHQYQQEHGVDMVVMGAYGHSRLREFFVGSTTNNMIRNASVPHLLLR
ncbi:universal stress protein UspA [Gammaproteobacteria bacterium 53_120_T64]|nr:universal stress protein UspA [Gammaproteobacteria bacterium 53_120_T64]